MKKRLLYLVAILVALAFWVVGLGAWPLVQWSALNCSHDDIDINSGRIRRQHFLVGLCVNESVEESSLSRLVSEVAAERPPEWHRVNTFSPMVHHSPHYRYHGAIEQIREIEAIWQLAPFTAEAKRQVARDVLSLWQVDEGDSLVNDYLNPLSQFIPQRREPEPIGAGDLPSIETIKKRQQENVR
jgi:hypothetical protein